MKTHNPPPWHHAQTILLDMDGTLLDLRFDNFFWLELLPKKYATLHNISTPAAHAIIKTKTTATQGTLQWYCTDHWSRELGMDVAALKHEAREHIRFLPGAENFLQRARQLKRRLVLVTNAHFDSLAVKAQRTGLTAYFDEAISSHSFGVPKEHPDFWLQLEARLGASIRNSLFVDDSLPVLHTAREHGIQHVVAISQPDSTLPARTIAAFPSVRCVDELLPAVDGRTDLPSVACINHCTRD